MRIGILGLGSMGRRHEANFKALGCEVIGYDPLVGKYRALNDALECDGVVIASPSIEHFRQIILCTKPMLVEKPIVMNREELELVPLGNILMVGYNLRFHSCVRKAKEWMGKGLIGKPLWAQFTCAQFNDKPVYQRDGVILNWSHEIDLALHLLGSADVLWASASAGEDCADLFLQHHRNQCRTTIHLDYLTRPELRGFTIVGEGGLMQCNIVHRDIYMLDIQGNYLDEHRGRDTFDDNYLDEAKMFLKLLKNEQLPADYFFCTAQEAHDVTDICLTAKEIISGKA